jgi:hypothetical protein
MSKMILNVIAVVCIAWWSAVATPSVATVNLIPVDPSNDLHFQFADKTCPTLAGRGEGLKFGVCKDGRIDATFDFDAPLLTIVGIFNQSDPSVSGKKFVKLTEAWWTFNGANAGDIFPGHTSDYGAIIPEPANWTLMITGIACIGIVTRRRRSAVAT